MKLTIDLDKCIMSGECYYNHPRLFEAQDDGFPRILLADITEEEREEAGQAVAVCPAAAITLD